MNSHLPPEADTGLTAPQPEVTPPPEYIPELNVSKRSQADATKDSTSSPGAAGTARRAALRQTWSESR